MDDPIAVEILQHVYNLSDVKSCHGIGEDPIVHFKEVFELSTLTVLHYEIESFRVGEGGIKLDDTRVV